MSVLKLFQNIEMNSTLTKSYYEDNIIKLQQEFKENYKTVSSVNIDPKSLKENTRKQNSTSHHKVSHRTEYDSSQEHLVQHVSQ